MNRSRISSSKRKRVSSTPQSKKSRLAAAAARHVTSVFGRLVSEAGVDISLGDGPNTINIEPALFKRKLSSSLRLHNTTHQSLDDFNTSMSDYFEDLKRFHYGLLPVKVAEGSDVTARLGGLDSFIRLLLGVELTQSHVVQLLVEKLMDFSSDFTLSSSQISSNDYQQLPNLILSQLIMMDFVMDGEKLCNGLLEVVDIVSVPLKRDIIQALPLILTDREHNNAATKLKDLLSDSELVAVVLSALTDLNTGTELEAEILDSAMARVRSADKEDLPTVITFINNHVTLRTGQALIAELRENLDLETCFTPLPVLSSTPFTTHHNNSSEQYVVLDTIRSSLVAKKEVADSWMKAIDAVSVEDDHKVIDLYVLFVLYSVCSRRKAVRNLLMAKVKSGLFTSRLITEMFNCRIPALNDVFPSVLSLCEHLLSSTASSFAYCLYTNAFASVDIFCRQEVVASLVTHTGSGIEKEVNHALDILTSLLDTHLTAMTRFAVIIKGVFDNLELLTVSQIRQLYSILSVLAHGYGNEELETGIQDELHVIIRKQLFHEEQKYRHMGVIGAVMIIKQISCNSPSSQHDTTIAQLHNEAQQQPLSESRKQQAISMIEQVTESCKTHHDAAALFYDEMATVVQKGGMDSAVLRHLAEEITTKFQDIYLIESTDQLPTDLRLPMEYQGGLDGQEDGSIALSLLPLLLNEEDGHTKCEGSLQSMCAHFHLLWVCEQILNNGSLEGVDALLGCPIVLCQQDKLTRPDFDELPLKQRQTICNCLLHCVNWERELVSAFAPSSDIEMRCKVLTRLTHITKLQNQLETCLAVTPGHFSSFDEGKKSGRGRKAKGKADATTQMNLDETAKDQTGILDKTTITHTTASQERVKTYFREFHLSAFQVLSYSPLSPSQLNNSALTGDIITELRPPQLLLLLQELASKTATCFSRFAKRGQSEGARSGDDLANVLVADLLPSLCIHLEDTSVFFQAQLVEQDGVVDARHEEREVRSRCLQTIIKILTALFSWTPLSDASHSALLLSAIKTIARRLSQSESQLDTTSSSVLASLAMQYLGKFSEFLPSLQSAYLLIKLLVAVCKVMKSDKQLKTAISDRCQKILKSSWAQLQNESNSQRNEALEYIVKYYMDWSPDPLVAIESMCREVIPELMGEDPQLESEQFQTLTVTTFPCYYRAMLCAAVGVVKTISPPSRNMLPTGVVVTERLKLLEISAKIFFMLVNLVKSFDGRPVLKAALKYGNKYVETFLRSGIPVVDSLFRVRKDDVTSLLKTVQLSTRCLQHYCTHSKVTKDTTLTNLIPSLKRSLESLVFRVKDVLTKHNCLEAFWLGILKNRDLQGREILSQYSQQTRSSSSSHSDDVNERTEEEEISDESDED